MKKLTYHIDIDLLVFLLLFTNVKLIVKVIAIAFIYARRFNFKFGFTLKNSRLPLFYPAIIFIAVINWVSGDIAISNYNPVFITGIFFWGMCVLAAHQVKLAVERNTEDVLFKTITAFFIINISASFIQLASIIVETGSLNPFRYQGLFQKYFISTGDFIKGISFDTSTTNAVISAFGVIYFLTKEKPVMLLLCMATLLLTASNLTNVVLLGIFMMMIFSRNRNRKSLIVVCSVMLLIFVNRVSPQNNNYVRETITAFSPGRTGLSIKWVKWKSDPTDVKPVAEKIKEQIAEEHIDGIRKFFSEMQSPNGAASAVLTRPEIPPPNIHSTTFQSRKDTTAFQHSLIDFISANSAALKLALEPFPLSHPGKVIAFQQTIHFIKEHPFRLLTGTGMGRFSSKLAFRCTALNIAGGYPAPLRYINHDFLSNHLDLYLYFYTKKRGEHSITNNPGSVYDQLLAEYGITGLMVFIIFYIGFFFKKWRNLSYGIPMLIALSALCMADYWFEQLSVIPLFEFLLFMDLKQKSSA